MVMCDVQKESECHLWVGKLSFALCRALIINTQWLTLTDANCCRSRPFRRRGIWKWPFGWWSWRGWSAQKAGGRLRETQSAAGHQEHPARVPGWWTDFQGYTTDFHARNTKSQNKQNARARTHFQTCLSLPITATSVARDEAPCIDYRATLPRVRLGRSVFAARSVETGVGLTCR